LKKATIKETEELMKAAGEALGETFENLGFALLVFPFNEPGVSNYVSNAEREDMITALREAANRLENNEVIGPAQGEA
jgi:hypothetical protein